MAFYPTRLLCLSGLSRKLFLRLLARAAPSHPSRLSINLVSHRGRFWMPTNKHITLPEGIPSVCLVIKVSLAPRVVTDWLEPISTFISLDHSHWFRGGPVTYSAQPGDSVYHHVESRDGNLSSLLLSISMPSTSSCFLQARSCEVMTITTPLLQTWKGSWHTELYRSWSQWHKPTLKPTLPLDLNCVNHTFPYCLGQLELGVC